MIDLQNFEVRKQIGKGSFGEVYEVNEKNTNNTFAAKISFYEINVEKITLAQDELTNILKLNHPSVIKYVGYNFKNFKNESKPTIIMEFAHNKSLNNMLNLVCKDQAPPQWENTKKLINIYGIASGMAYLHANNFVHHDLKPENILLDEYLYPKIKDFEFLKIFSDALINFESEKNKYSIYTPPEFYNGEYSFSSDVYSFSTILYQILTNKIPFQNLNQDQLREKVIKEGFNPIFDESFPESYKKLILSCGSLDPEKRPAFKEIVQQLQTDNQFILQDIKKDEYFNYIEFIKEYLSNLQSSNTIIKLDDFFKNKNSCIQKVSYLSQKILENQNISDQNELNAECKLLVENAENDPEIQCFVGKSYIENKNGFPMNAQLGIQYLKRSMKGGCVEATIYYCKLLKKGKIIPVNLEKAKKILQKALETKNADVYALYGNILKKEKDYEQAKKYLMKAINRANGNAMIDYGKMLMNGEGCQSNPEEALYYFEMAKRNNHIKADKYISMLSQQKGNTNSIENNLNEIHGNEYEPIKIKLKSTLKIILLGDSGVGKTKLLNAMLNFPFCEFELPTVGAPLLNNLVISRDDNTLVDLIIWDTCGQEKYSELLTIQTYRDVDVSFICYIREDTESIRKWVTNVKEYSPDCYIFLVETKVDLLDQEQKESSQKIGKELVMNYKCYMHIMTSAKTREGINELLKFASNISFANIEKKMSTRILSENEVLHDEHNNNNNCC